MYCFDEKTDVPSQAILLLYSSSNYIVVNKQHDVLLNCNDSNGATTVQKQLSELLPHLADSSLVHQFRFPHRLDFATSGVLCVALNKKAAQMAVDAFALRRTDKYYLALLHGHVKNNLTVDLAVGKDGRPQNSHRMCSAGETGQAFCVDPKTAKTQLLILQRGQYDGKAATKVLLKPSTGRRHQLRVHCMEIGHTIVGDYTYSDRQDCHPYRMFLHAFRLVVPTAAEVVDVATSDPFTAAEPRNRWNAEMTVCELDKDAFARFTDKDSFVLWDENSGSNSRQ